MGSSVSFKLPRSHIPRFSHTIHITPLNNSHGMISGPPDLLGTSNMIVKVVEFENTVIGDIGIFTKPEDPTVSHYSTDL
ncbi:hypothetical protein L6452_17656 [Arctium lappa]|uniref:Uncharacterized protein n=1 Tax=Arctium lappa TaxID=4217 RepID=A0ACB9C459_ARCLA|nr:hypothetical protein L6452_17656 [Arctium lappa]